MMTLAPPSRKDTGMVCVRCTPALPKNIGTMWRAVPGMQVSNLV